MADYFDTGALSFAVTRGVNTKNAASYYDWICGQNL